MSKDKLIGLNQTQIHDFSHLPHFNHILKPGTL